MKQNSRAFVGFPCLAVGAIMLAFFAFTSSSRADVETVVNNLGSSGTYVSGFPLGQVFTMSSTAGELNSLTLQMYANPPGGAEIDLYTVSSGQPNSLLSVLGSITTSVTGNGQNLAVVLTSFPNLTADTQYAIVVQSPSSGLLAWDQVNNTSSGGTGSALGGQYYESGGVWYLRSDVNSFQMELQTTPVPEVPATGLVMGIGVLAIAVGNILRRKLRPAVSSIA